MKLLSDKRDSCLKKKYRKREKEQRNTVDPVGQLIELICQEGNATVSQLGSR